jgi:hypothetical protein
MVTSFALLRFFSPFFVCWAADSLFEPGWFEVDHTVLSRQCWAG